MNFGKVRPLGSRYGQQNGHLKQKESISHKKNKSKCLYGIPMICVSFTYQDFYNKSVIIIIVIIIIIPSTVDII